MEWACGMLAGSKYLQGQGQGQGWGSRSGPGGGGEDLCRNGVGIRHGSRVPIPEPTDSVRVQGAGCRVNHVRACRRAHT